MDARHNASCHEVSQEQLGAHRSCGTLCLGHVLAALATACAQAQETHLQDISSNPVTEKLLEALAWSTGLKDRGMLVALVGDMHEVLRDEQIRKH